MIRTRIAPSPTGKAGLHLGNIRTALFNYLYAKRHDGTFVYRLENTDIARNSEEGIHAIRESFEWLGIRPDEGYGYGGDFGPYDQLSRLNIYKQFADKLIDEGKAYRCYCASEELEAKRSELLAKDPKAQFKYPGICRDRKDQPKDKPYVVRLKTSVDGFTEYNDLVFGKIKTPNREMQDVVLMRSNGIPLYNYGCVIDDITMQITHVARGRDHQINTPIQLLIYDALGTKPPEFAHLPMMLGPDGAKLSKRHASVSALEYRDLGYSPNSVLNYIARFGWSHGNQEVFSKQELIDLFSWEACGKKDGKFDVKKFAAIQFEHLKSNALTSDAEYAHHTAPFIKADCNKEQVSSVVNLVRTKCKTFIEAGEFLTPIFQNNIEIDKEAADKFLINDNKNIIKDLALRLNAVQNWNEQTLRDAVGLFLTERQLMIKDIGQPLRVSLTGKTTSPELFQIMVALGKDSSIRRLNNI